MEAINNLSKKGCIFMKKLIAIIAIMLGFSITAFGNGNLQGVQLKDINNKPVSLDKYKGKKVYIKVWASWCPICLSGLNEINSLSADKNKNFTVITIVSPGLKGEKPTDKFIQWYKGLNYKNITVLLDEKGTVIKRAKMRKIAPSIEEIVRISLFFLSLSLCFRSPKLQPRIAAIIRYFSTFRSFTACFVKFVSLPLSVFCTAS